MDTEKWIDSKNGIVDLEFEESDKISKNFSVPLIKDEDIKQEKSTPDELDFGVNLLETSNADYEVKIEEDEPVTKKQKFEKNTDFTDVRKFNFWSEICFNVFLKISFISNRST